MCEELRTWTETESTGLLTCPCVWRSVRVKSCVHGHRLSQLTYVRVPGVCLCEELRAWTQVESADLSTYMCLVVCSCKELHPWTQPESSDARRCVWWSAHVKTCVHGQRLSRLTQVCLMVCSSNEMYIWTQVESRDVHVTYVTIGHCSGHRLNGAIYSYRQRPCSRDRFFSEI